ncbi:MAG: hypothetical protein IPL42_09500 [Saprospiraceae bacterium]|nr:hypothetical protein [Saprospiraceae bacterium]
MRWSQSLTLSPNQKQCFYMLPEGVLSYDILPNIADRAYIKEEMMNHRSQGQIMIEKCKSKTYEIK